MGVKALGYVVIEASNPANWDAFLTQVAGVMRAPDAADGAALYRIDDRIFRFRVEASNRDMKWRMPPRSTLWPRASGRRAVLLTR